MRLSVDSTLSGEDAEPRWDIDVRSYEMVDRVQFYVERFTHGETKERFVDRLGHGTRFEPMIRAKLRAGDLPEDMYYLALVESGFDPNAYSRAAAVGMWQFMSSTARGMGLRVDWWVDERRDPVRSTEAAVRFLRGLREQFGSMYLAAAAYNGGPGRISRGLTRYADQLEGSSGDDMFFALAETKYLRNETREYVPQLVAAALVAKDSARYGIVIPTQPSFAYDSVKLGPRVPVVAIARAAGTSVSAVQELNPHILRGMTPPRDSMKVRIPPGTRARFDSAFAEMPPDVTVGAHSVVTRKGATWASLASQAKVSARAVSNFNPKVKASRQTGTIAAGTTVLVPTPLVVQAFLSVPDPSIERFGSSAGARTYVVRPGDNLSVIAKRNGTTAAAIMRLNGLRKPLIFPGQELLVKGRPGARGARTAKAPTKRATAQKR
ncbi:MAG TPA: transglycosylase SLT domain-containing protein [Gemmatimonadaceae bacterium]|nr:transglycosylase SLT domain-containing protein [Gemmatimonadaceae bacterium]